jgi:hypothetical protein
MPIERRRELADNEVTLDGKRAVICGIKNDFATVAQIPDGKRADFAWVSVENIVKHWNGEFLS